MQCGGTNLVCGIDIQPLFYQPFGEIAATKSNRLVECRVALVIPKPDIGVILQKQLERLPGAGPDDMKDRRFTSGIGIIHWDAGLDTIAQFFQVTKTCSLGNGIRVLAGG